MQSQHSLALIFVGLSVLAGCLARDLPLAQDSPSAAAGRWAGVAGVGISGSGAAGEWIGTAGRRGTAGEWTGTGGRSGRGTGGTGGRGTGGQGTGGTDDMGAAGDWGGAAGVRSGNAGWGGSTGYAGSSAAGVGGVSGSDGGVAGAFGAAGAGVDQGPHCCADSDPCSIDSCHEGPCDPHEARAPGKLGADADGDNYVAGCGAELDCWDRDAHVHPGQTDFFDQPFEGATPSDWDYNCDDRLEPEFTTPFERCAYIGALDTCVGNGWMLAGNAFPPLCGAGGPYAVCRASQGKCTYDVVMLAQRCR
jgi:hypothetical protein